MRLRKEVIKIVYQGSKASLMKDIAPIVNGLIKANKIDVYVEPFVGGANSFVEIDKILKIGYDNNKYLIALLNHIKTHPLKFIELTKDEYRFVIHNMDYFQDWFAGFIAYCYSFRGIFRGGYSNMNGDFKVCIRQINNLNKQRLKINQLDNLFYFKDFYDVSLVDHLSHLIYLDPPYIGTSGYRIKTSYSFEKLEEKCKEWSLINKKNIILLSERKLIEDPKWEIIWCKEVINNLQNKKEKVIEYLYKYKGSE